jgi:site-specific recombinase XerC
MATKGAQYAEFPNNTWDRVLKRATALAREADQAARPINGGPHRARHTFASHFLSSKPDIFLLGRLLGHGHARVTELYAHLIPEHLAEARNVVTFAASAAPKPGRPEPPARATSGEPSPDHPQQAPQSEAG